MSSSKMSSNQSTSEGEIKSGPNDAAEKKVPFWKKVNDAMDGAKKAVDTGMSINERLGNPIGVIAGALSKFTKAETKNDAKTSNEENLSQGETNFATSEDVINDVDEKQASNEETSKEILTKNGKDLSAVELLESQLQACSKNPSYDEAIKNMLLAELKTLRVLKTPNNLQLQNFSDLIMEDLSSSYEYFCDNQDRQNFQKIAGLLIRSIINYLQARIAFLENDKEDIIQNFVDDAADSFRSATISALRMVFAAKLNVTNAGPMLNAQLEFDQNSINNACEELKNSKRSFSFLTKLFFKDKKKQEKMIFYSFLAELFESLRKYKKIFGTDNRGLSQIVERYGSIIAKEHCFSEEKINEGIDRMKAERPDLIKRFPRMPLKFSFASFIVIVLVATFMVDCGVVYAIRDIDYFVLVMVLIIILSIIIACSILGFASNELFDDADDKWNERKKVCMEKRAGLYYKALAKMFYDFDKNLVE